MRAVGFIDQHGHDCAEIDAIPPTELRRRVQQAIVEHIDADAWNRLMKVEKAEHETLAKVVKRLKVAG